jgi:NAD(P)-dependent dehydrogenase (short-subunit alcohol dehydrogenase family)
MNDSRVALVTGSATGLGAAIVERLAQDGLAVVVNYRTSRQAAEALVERIRPSAVDSMALQADVSQPAEAERLIGAVLARFGRIDVLVNNAGPWLVKPAFETTVDEWNDILANNLSSTFYCCKFALASMRARHSGVIINIGSANVELARGSPTVTAYNIAKTGVVVLSRSLARTEGPFGIRVNCVNPGYMDLPTLADDERERITPQVPVRRIGSASEVADAVAYLASERASYINGAVLNVTGGLWV